MARTLEAQHKRERDYYLRKTDKLDGKPVSEMQKDFRKHEKEYFEKIEKRKNAARAKAKSTAKDEAKLAPVSTAVTFGVIDEVKPTIPSTENLAQNANTAQTDNKEAAKTDSKSDKDDDAKTKDSKSS